MTGVKFLLKVTMRRLDLAAEIYHLKEPQKVPVVLSPDEVKRILVMAPSVKAHTMLTISYGCGLRAGEVTRLRVGDIDSARRIGWVVYCKQPFAGPKQVLRYLSRYTHRVAISNCRLVAADDGGIAFRYKDYRIDGPGRWKTMTLAPGEFIRRFLIHVLPKGLHRIRHYGLFANGNRAANLARARELLVTCSPSSLHVIVESIRGVRSMRKSRFSESQIIGVIKEQEAGARARGDAGARRHAGT